MFTANLFSPLIDAIDCCPWGASAGRNAAATDKREAVMTRSSPSLRRPLYTPEERVRRDATPWTLVQGILAPIQFLVFLVSLGLVTRFLLTGQGQAMAEFSVIVKTLVLYTIMVTGAIWEREVFGRYLFAPSFYWEDMVSMLVIALHTAYVVALYQGALSATSLSILALSAYAIYVINAVQFVLKLRAARMDEARCRAQAMEAA
jgi:3-vinyl bacteriochlorophyllide hydratase